MPKVPGGYSQKWAVASFFDEQEDDFIFKSESTPLHATLAGVFAVDAKMPEIATVVRGAIRGTRVFEIEISETEQWGDIRVSVMQDSVHFTDLFKAVQGALLDNGAQFNEPQYLNQGFRPHVTQQKTGFLREGDKKLVKSISLVDMFPDGDGEKRRIVTTIDLV